MKFRICSILLHLLFFQAAQSQPTKVAIEQKGKGGAFVFRDVSEKSVGLWEGQKPIFVYNYGVISKEGVPADRNRSSYIHPLYGLDGEILTDDFPKDHYHHRGLFWAWPHVKIGEQEASLWDLRGIETRFEKWITKEARQGEAVLGVENGWYIGNRKVVQERVFLRVLPSTDQRMIDIDLEFTPLDAPLTLQGAEGKSYGGLTLRFAPKKETVITTILGQKSEDLPITHLPWADLSGLFNGKPAGAAIFVSPNHPDYPPEWLTRHYGVLCLGWPGVTAQTFPAGRTIHCSYRIWIHRDKPSQERVAEIYKDYVAGEANRGGRARPAK